MVRIRLGLLFISGVCLAITLVGCGGTGSGQVTSGGFTLSASPSSLNVVQGSPGATGTITITPQNGFNGSVTLSASGLPSGVTAAFNPSSATTTSTLTLAASASAALGTTTVTITGVSGSLTSSTTVSLTVIKQGQIDHVVIIFQENRTVDNLFQGLCTANGSPGCDPTGADSSKYNIASSGLTPTVSIPLTTNSSVTTYYLGHSHGSFLFACDYNPSTNSCAMDGWQKVPCSGTGCPANASYQYVDPSDVQPYLTLAETYAFGDHMFQTNEGPSFPAHQYILSGTSRIAATSNTTVADNPSDNERPNGGGFWAGCLAPETAFVNAIDISQPSPETPLTDVDFPLCFEHPTLTDLLDTAGISWKYYAPMAGSIWTAPDAIEHMCQPTSADGKYDDTVCSGPDWTASDPKVVIEGSSAQIITDINSGSLASVSWVIPTGDNSDHAGNPEDNGPSWVTSIVNAIGTSQYWPDTVIIIAWDDFGGWYDHVPPPLIRDSYEYGFRVPLIVVSPYAKPKYISHQVNDFGSILKFVEEIFALPNPIDYTNPATPYADEYALGDLSDFFNFNEAPQPFTQIQAPLKAEHFLNDKSPPTPPDND